MRSEASGSAKFRKYRLDLIIGGDFATPCSLDGLIDGVQRVCGGVVGIAAPSLCSAHELPKLVLIPLRPVAHARQHVVKLRFSHLLALPPPPPFHKHCTTMQRGNVRESPVLKLWNDSGTNRARIADSTFVGIRSRPYL